MNKMYCVRCHWIDNLKFFALFLVVFGHIGNTKLHYLVYGFHMPLFFFLSGMLHKDKSAGKICRRLLVPYLLFNTFYLSVELFWLYRQNGNFNFVFDDVLGIIIPFGHPIDYPTWFLLCLFEIKFFIKLCKNHIQATLYIAFFFLTLCSLLNWNLQTAPFFLKNALIGMVFYDAGYLIYRYHLFIFNHRLSIVFGGGAMTLYSFFMLYSPSCIWNEALGNPCQFLYSLLACLGSTWIFQGMFDTRCGMIEKRVIGGIGIIGLHPLFIQYLRRLILLIGGTWGNFSLMEIIAMSIIVMLSCIATIPFIRKYFPLLIGLDKNKL